MMKWCEIYCVNPKESNLGNSVTKVYSLKGLSGHRSRFFSATIGMLRKSGQRAPLLAVPQTTI
jgi:hypothetical protein